MMFDAIVLAGFAILIVAAAFFAAAEAALFTISPVEVIELEESGSPAAKRIRRLIENPPLLILTLAVSGEGAAMTAAIGLAGLGSLPTDYWGMVLVGRVAAALPDSSYSGFLTVFAVLLFLARAVPKGMGVFMSDEVSRPAAPLIVPLFSLLEPLWRFSRKTGAGLRQALGGVPAGSSAESSAIRDLVEAGSRDGLLDITERELLANLLRFGEVLAEDIMTPRQELVSIPAGATLAAARRMLEEEQYSRIPVYEADPEKIVGVITAKSLLKSRFKGGDENTVMVREVMKPPLMVPGSRRSRDLLVDFKRSRNHLALVVDEFGSLAGVVTMEDVLEEIFGESREDDEDPEFENLGGGKYRVRGSLETSEFAALTGARLPGNATRTVAGLFLAMLGRRPKPGDEVILGGFRFKVAEAQGIIIKRLEVSREDKT